MQGVFMGNLIDGEPDGIPHPNAVGDDITNLPDEDGVFFVTPLIVGQPAQVDVFVSVPGWLDIWIDFTQNGTWLDPGEQVYSGPAVLGLNSIIFNVPAGIAPGIISADRSRSQASRPTARSKTMRWPSSQRSRIWTSATRRMARTRRCWEATVRTT
jgi:hypothetical protein